MASDLGFVEFIVGQIENVGEITYKKRKSKSQKKSLGDKSWLMFKIPSEP